MVQANRLSAKEEHEAAEKLRNQAFETAPSIAGIVNDEKFSWIADADSRLGPILELIIEGNYYWTSFNNIKLLKIEPPEDLRDVVWLPASIIWKNKGQTVGFIPTRYESSENSDDSNILLSRKTEWIQKTDDTYIGLGQRMITTDIAEYPLMEIKKIIFEHPE
ncbi:MAG: virulence protein SciE type, partial [Desulfamplus sp.]|nr:virulence protein SciE type [Desulfamplus sp.]